MKFYFYTSIAFEDWYWETSVKEGIGGSETSIVEMSWRLAREGHDVTIYAPIPKGIPATWRGTKWFHHSKADFSQKGIWIIYRVPSAIKKFPKPHTGQKVWLLMQDWDYPDLDKYVGVEGGYDKIITLCKSHGNYTLKNHPKIGKKLWLTSNGIKVDLIEEVEKNIQSEKIRFAFDWGGTLEMYESLRDFARRMFEAGHEVYIVPALLRGTDFNYEEKLRSLNVPYHAIYRVFVESSDTPGQIAEKKRLALSAIDAHYFWDDTYANIMAARKIEITSYYCKGKNKPQLPKITPFRNPLRVMYASSPDRGLKQAILVFRKAKEFIPELELHAFYGFNNLSKLTKGNPHSHIAKQEAELKELIKNTKGVTYHGRVSQPELYREWFKSGIYLYITDFFETSNIASQEAQAMGAVPVFSPIFAQGENIKHGIGVEGKSLDPLTISRAAAELVRIALVPQLQEQIRGEMMDWARKRFNWDVFVQQWIMEAQNKRAEFEEKYEFPRQLWETKPKKKKEIPQEVVKEAEETAVEKAVEEVEKGEIETDVWGWGKGI